MYSSIKFILLAILLVTLYSCEFSSDPKTTLPEKFEYPLMTGNVWEYERVFEHFNFRPESIKDVFGPTKYIHQSRVEVIKDTTLQDSINCFVIRETVVDYIMGDLLSWGYYSNEQDGLYQYGYRSPGPGVIKPRERRKVTYNIAGLSFRSIKEVSDYYSKYLPTFAPSNDTLIVYDKSRKILTYPLEIGEIWTLHDGQPFTIHKTILGTELVSTDVGNFNCYKIQWTYDSSFADNILFYDYICEKGLIKRTIFFNDILVRSTDFPDGNGYVDSKDETILTGININN